MAASLMPAVWSHFIFNLLLQVFDGLLTYHVLSDGIPEANPLVSSAIVQWGMVWGLLYWKTVPEARDLRLRETDFSGRP